MTQLITRQRLGSIGRWLWPTVPVNSKVKPEPAPEPITWEAWHGQHVKIAAGPFKGRQGMAAGIGWGRVEVVFPGFHRVWFDGPLLTRLSGPKK